MFLVSRNVFIEKGTRETSVKRHLGQGFVVTPALLC